MNGVILKSYDMVEKLIQKVKTKTGLRVDTYITEKQYLTKRKYRDDFKENMKIQFDPILPKWNYTAVPTFVEKFG